MGDKVGLADRDDIKIDLERERRDIKDIWIDALRTYKGVLGEELKPTFANVDAMIEYANMQMDTFHKWRHDATKVDRLRSLFRENMGYIQTATQMIITAAEPAFPPAAAIGTVLTFVLSACKSVSADYDVVITFFDDMNSFLQRVSILEARLPVYKSYQACLMDVFTSLLKMCAFAQKFIKQGRLKKWAINALQGDDSDLNASRKAMDKALDRLQSATEFAILANTENIVGSQQILQLMQQELQQNQLKQVELQESQQMMLRTMLEGQVNVQDEIGDIKKLLEALQSTNDDQEATNRKKDARSVTNAVRAIINDIPENELQLRWIQDAHVPGTCTWIFDEPAWKTWYTNTDPHNNSPLLLIKGTDGVGKSHLAATIYEQIERDVSKNPSGSSCAVYFFCHESIANLRSFQSIIDWTILRISDINVTLRNRLNSMLSRDPDRMLEEEYLTALISPLFNSESQFFLYIVIDAVDALETDWDRNLIFDLAHAIEQSGLRIKLVATMRLDTKPAKPHEFARNDWVSDNELVVTKDKIVPDMRKIILDRLQTTDSAYRNIRYLNTDIKELIAIRLEEQADGLLYVEQSLLCLSSLGREGSVRKLMNTTLPADVTGWFHKLIEKCERRMPHDLVAPFRFLLTWLLFSLDSLSLDGLNQLLRLATSIPDLDVGDEIMDTYSGFLQIHSALPNAGNAAATGKIISTSDPLPVYEDANAKLIFRKRSMREFFLCRRADAGKLSPSTTTSHGHRQLFLLCCRIIEEHATSRTREMMTEGYGEIHHYALNYCLRHWYEICPGHQSLEENVTVYEAFFNLLDGKQGFATQIESKGLNFTIDKLLTFHKNAPDTNWDANFFDRWNEWSRGLQDETVNPHAPALKARLTKSTADYWTKDHTSALTPLAMAHLYDWSVAKKPNEAIVAYNFARKTVQKTLMQDLLCPEYPTYSFDNMHDDVSLWGGQAEGDALHDEILRLRDVSGSSSDSNAHFATAVLTKSVDVNTCRAVQEMEQALEKCDFAADKFRFLTYLGKLYYWHCSSLEDCLRYLHLALELREQIPRSDVISTLELEASILYRVAKIDEASSIFQEICLLDPESPVVDSLAYDRFVMYMRAANWPTLMGVFFDLSAIQRIKVALRWFNWHNSPFAGTHPAILRGAIAAGNVDGLLQIYASMVETLGINNMEPIWMPFLAQIHWAWHADTIVAKTVLMKALDTSCTVQTYPLAEVDTGIIAVRNVNMLLDILFEQFQQSRDFDTKIKLTKEASKLFQQRLPQSVQINDTDKIPHLLVLANMNLKVGTAQDYEKLLRQAFDTAWASLNDSITCNDSDGVRYLSRTIGQIPDFQREAMVLSSAMLSYLGDHSFFAGFCIREGLHVEATAVTDFEKDMDGQTIDDKAGDNPDLPMDYECLRRTYDKYRSADSHNFNDYYLLRDLDFGEAWEWQPPVCSRSAFCADEIDCNSLSRSFNSWDDGPLYTCLRCTESILCQKCYDVRMQWNTTGKPDGELSFCCSNGKYIRSPTQDWQGIKLQCIYLQGQEPIKFDEFLQQIRAKWNEYWDQFWLG